MELYIADAFTATRFCGNQAGVALLGREPFPEEGFLRALAGELKHSETAFVRQTGERSFHIRYFTPAEEVDLCGHATLATAYVITRFFQPEVEEIKFYTLSGLLTVRKRGELLEMDFPAYRLKPLEVTDEIVDALGARPAEVWRARDLLCVMEREEDVLNLAPDMEKLKKLKGALMQATARGSQYDCVSRSFAPKMGVPEDPVCGSGHCHIIPYWADKLGKTEFVARQASPRGGTLYCRLEGDRVILAGRAALYAQTDLMLEDI